jgi:shikimate kinase
MLLGREIHNLVLIGFMATGKTTVGRIASQRLGFDFIDTDAWIESRLNQSIPQIFAEQGEAWFRQYESTLVQELAGYRRSVIATGGGLGANPENLAELKKHALVVCLWASPEAIWNRAKRNGNRPLLKDPDPLGKIRRLLEARRPVYRQADVLVDAEWRPLIRVSQQVVQHFLQAVKSHPSA